MRKRGLIACALGGLTVLAFGSCDGQGKGSAGSGDEMQEIEFVRPVKEPEPETPEDFTEESHGTPIEGKQAAPKDGLVPEPTKEDEALWY